MTTFTQTPCARKRKAPMGTGCLGSGVVVVRPEAPGASMLEIISPHAPPKSAKVTSTWRR